jgi:helix-turn-helix protein
VGKNVTEETFRFDIDTNHAFTYRVNKLSESAVADAAAQRLGQLAEQILANLPSSGIKPGAMATLLGVPLSEIKSCLADLVQRGIIKVGIDQKYLLVSQPS